MKKKTKMRSPAEVKTFAQVCQLETDNCNTNSSWVMVCDNGNRIAIVNQQSGHPKTGEVSLTRREMKRFIEWYTKPQKVTK